MAMVRFHLASFERYTTSLVVAMGLRDERADSLFAIRTEVVRRQSLDLESEALRVFDALGLRPPPREIFPNERIRFRTPRSPPRDD